MFGISLDILKPNIDYLIEDYYQFKYKTGYSNLMF